MGQKHSRPNPSSVPDDEQQLTPQQNFQHNLSQQHSAAQQGYAASPVLQPQYTPPQYAGYTNGAVYGGYASGPYGGMQPPGPHTVYQPPPGPYMPAVRPPVPTAAVQQTQTIKNQVNLMKKTLKLEPMPGEPDTLLLKFSFSATAPCRVSTFVLATEDPSQALRVLYSVTPELRTPAYYDRGVNQQFPPNDALAQQHAIRLVHDGKRKEDTLQTTGPASFPLIIRLEALTQQAAQAGKDLQQLPIGASLPEWIQAQCTYAMLKKDDEGKWALQVLKQKIWVNGVSYELHEIYGMEATRTGGSNSASAASEDVDGRECVVCISAPRDTTVLPCRHMCLCKDCAQKLRNQSNKCPICREPMESLLHIKQ